MRNRIKKNLREKNFAEVDGFTTSQGPQETKGQQSPAFDPRKNPQVPWENIAGMRDVHDYVSVDIGLI